MSSPVQAGCPGARVTARTCCRRLPGRVVDMGPSDFRASITELQAVLLGTESIDGFLQELASLAARELGEGLSCGITLQPDGRPLTLASSGANAAQIDELQYRLDHGPCLTALRTGELVRIDDLASDQR